MRDLSQNPRWRKKLKDPLLDAKAKVSVLHGFLDDYSDDEAFGD